MPGYVIHLAVAETLIEACGIERNAGLQMTGKTVEACENINRFLLGSIVPDIRKGSRKKNTHFWSDETMKHFQRKPDLKAFLAKYSEFLSDPFVFGYYAHLYLDYKFVNEYWRSHFSFFDEHMQETDEFDLVRSVKYTGTPHDTDNLVSRERFFSEEYYYGDYSRMNDYVMQSYNIRIPYFDFDGFHPGDAINIIDEVRGADLLPALREMIAFLKRAFSEMPRKYVDETALQEGLKVFNLKAMKELIAQTAKELCPFVESNGIFVE